MTNKTVRPAFLVGIGFELDRKIDSQISFLKISVLKSGHTACTKQNPRNLQQTTERFLTYWVLTVNQHILCKIYREALGPRMLPGLQ
jgi:hypothetical protein